MNSHELQMVGRKFSAEKMMTYALGTVNGSGLAQSRVALRWMKKYHMGQTRKDGQPYIIHPLMMYLYASSLRGMGLVDGELPKAMLTDEMLATILLHDVCEETGTLVKDLPVNDVVKAGVEYMTITKYPGEGDFESKRRYFYDLLKSKEALVCKLVDRYFNLSTMAAVFPEDKIRKNVVETDLLLLPVAHDAKGRWPEISTLLWVLRTNVRNINDTLALMFGVKLTDPDFVNPPDAKDYSYLVTGVAE